MRGGCFFHLEIQRAILTVELHRRKNQEENSAFYNKGQQTSWYIAAFIFILHLIREKVKMKKIYSLQCS